MVFVCGPGAMALRRDVFWNVDNTAQSARPPDLIGAQNYGVGKCIWVLISMVFLVGGQHYACIDE